MQALILAAGKGTRLHPITNYVPKPMLPLHGKPLMEWVILPLIESGVKDFVVAVSYFAEQIQNYFGNGEKWNVHIDYSYGPSPAGKAGEIWRAARFLGGGDGTFLVVPGDTICHLDYRALFDFHRNHKSPVTVAFSTNYRLEVGIAEIDERRRIRKFYEKANLNRPVSTGAYVLDGRIFPYIEKFISQKEEVDLPGDIFPALLEKDIPIYGYISDYQWWDVGRISDYEDLAELPPETAAHIFKWDAQYSYS
jgi:NDP-sugar pyrophosphorylase family protein